MTVGGAGARMADASGRAPGDTGDDWRDRLVEDDAAVAALARTLRRVAVVGIRPASAAGRPAHDVAAWLQGAGLEIVPVPTAHPEVHEILGRPVERRLAAAARGADAAVLFRKPEDVAGHLPDLLAARPRVVWMQLGIREPQVAEVCARAGLLVVQDRCLQRVLAGAGDA